MSGTKYSTVLFEFVSQISLPEKESVINSLANLTLVLVIGLLETIAAIAVESAVKHSFVSKCIQTKRKVQYKAEFTFLPCLHVKRLITLIIIH